MCRELDVSRSGYYKWKGRGCSDRERDDRTLTLLIEAIHSKLRGNPGVRRVHAALAAAGRRVSRKRVWRLMRAAGLQGRFPKPFRRTTIRGSKPVDAPDRIGRDFTAERPNERWCGDITYVKTWTGAYLATVIDLPRSGRGRLGDRRPHAHVAGHRGSRHGHRAPTAGERRYLPQ